MRKREHSFHSFSETWRIRRFGHGVSMCDGFCLEGSAGREDCPCLGVLPVPWWSVAYSAHVCVGLERKLSRTAKGEPGSAGWGSQHLRAPRQPFLPMNARLVGSWLCTRLGRAGSGPSCAAASPGCRARCRPSTGSWMTSLSRRRLPQHVALASKSHEPSSNQHKGYTW